MRSWSPVSDFGTHYIAAWKGIYSYDSQYAVSDDVTVETGPSTVTAPQLQLLEASENLIYNRPELLSTSSYGTTENLGRLVEGTVEHYSWNGTSVWWCSDTADETYLYIDFGGSYDIDDMVLYHPYMSHWWANPAIVADNDYKIEVMTKGDPSDGSSWSDELSEVETVYDPGVSSYGFAFNKFVVGEGYALEHEGDTVNPIRIDREKVKGIRITFSNPHPNCDFPFALNEIKVHGKAPGTVVNSVGDAKKLSKDTVVSIHGKQVTACYLADGSMSNGLPANTVFIEEEDRSSGIRLDVTGLDVSQVMYDYTSSSVISVMGIVRETDAGEKYIECLDLTWLEDRSPKIAPLGMNNRFAGTKMAQGLYVKLWGIATDAVPVQYPIVTYRFDDGSGTPIKVYCVGGLPEGLIRVHGVLSTEGTDTVLYMTDTDVEQDYN